MDINEKTKFEAFCEYFRRQRPDLTAPNFQDDIFPPNLNSLIKLDPYNDSSKEVTEDEVNALKVLQWKRAKDIFKNDNFILYNKIEVEDIHQGELGNCYFLSSLSALAENDDRYHQIFQSKKKSENGCYVLRLMIRGIPKYVVLDDFFPCYKTGRVWFALAQSGHMEIWVQLLEKAWAKINGSYAATIAGLPSEALSALTEAPCINYIHRRYSEDEMWQILKESDIKNHVICTNTCNSEEATKMGLVTSHAYTVISLYEIQGLRLVKLRNPWGSFEWKGEFNDHSDKWNIIPNLKNIVGCEAKDDGIFFMEFKDFLKYFPYTFVCKYENGFVYNYKKIHQYSDTEMQCCKIKLNTDSNVTIALHQKQQRFYSKVKFYKLQLARIIVAKLNQNGEFEYVHSHASSDEILHVELKNLPKEEYYVFTNVNWPYDSLSKYTISTYSSNPVEIEEINRDDIPVDYLTQILSSYLNKKCKKTQLNDSMNFQSSLNDNNLGFYMVQFNNTSNNVTKINFQATNTHLHFLNIDNLNNSVKLGNNRISEEVEFNVKERSSKMVVWKLLQPYWTAKLEISKIVTSASSSYSNKDNPDQSSHNIPDMIGENINSCVGESLNSECDYIEMETEDSILFVIRNNSEAVYKFKILFNFLIHLTVHNGDRIILRVPARGFSFIQLRKTRPSDHNYNFAYSFKKLI